MADARDDIWVVVPSYNEGEIIRSTLSHVLESAHSVVVVDDHSTDDTVSQISDLPIHLCSHAINLGAGAALQTGISYALENGAKYLVTFDADGQHRAEEISQLLAPLRSGAAEIVLGSRFLEPDCAKNIPWLRKRVLALAVRFTRLTTGLNLTDTHNGFRAFTREAATKMRITQNRMSHASEILSEIRRLRLRYVEVPVTIDYTPYSLKKGQKLRNSFNILWDLASARVKK